MHLLAQVADAGTSSSVLFIGPFTMLAVAIPELLLGEFIFHRVG